MSQPTHVVIIGGGVSGCSIAYQLSKAGIRVTVLERGEIAAEASGAAAGLLAPGGVLTGPAAGRELFLASWSLTAKTIAEIEEASGISVEYHQTGALHTITSAEEEAQERRYAQVWQDYGLAVQWLKGAEVHEYEPRLNPTIEAALYIPHATSIRPRLVTLAYAEAARRLGARIREHSEVTGLVRSSARVTGVQTTQDETIECDTVILAAGAWSAQIGRWLGLNIPVIPARGQILALQQLPTPLQHTIFGEGLYVVPKVDNTIYVGATIERVGFDKSNTAGGLTWLLSSVIRLLPELEHASIARIWAGLRPLSQDAYPILGRAPSWQNVILATGHGAGGFELSAITGTTIAELITTGRSPAVIQPFGLERFIK